MKKTMYFNMNAPEYSDPIDVKNLSDNFNVIDYGLMTSRCSKSRTTNSINERAVLPYYKILNDNEFDVVVVNRNFDNVETTIKAGEELKVNVSDINRSMNYMVKDLHEVTFEWFITVEDAIKEGGGGSGGTSNYNDLTNKPQINGTTLSGNKTLADIGILNADGKIKSDLLPPFVDNMDSYNKRSDFPSTGVEDRIYLAKDTNLTYIWDGTDYAVVGGALALGETSSTAYRGDRGKTAYDHSQTTHARTDATAVSTSSTNGNIKINGTETTVYTHPKATGSSDTNPHGTTASDVGLGNVGNFKAVSTASQSLSDTEKSTARANIGAGTSSFDGKYSSLSDIPSTFTPASHTHEECISVNPQTLTEEQKAQARANIGAGSAGFSGDYNDLVNKPKVDGQSSIGTGKTIKSWSETDGKISITTQDIEIDKSQISDFTHTHTASDITDLGDMGFATEQYVTNAIDELPNPMIFKGSLGTDGTITTLPTASKSNIGFTYKVITDGTYSGQVAKSGDMFISDGTAWVYIPSADDGSNGTVTSVKVEGINGVSGSGIITTSGIIQLSNSGVRSIEQDDNDGHKLKINTNGTETTITIPDNDTTYSSKSAASGGSDVSLVTTGEKYTWNNKFALSEGNALKNMYIGAGVTNNGKSYTISNDKIYMLTLQSGTNSAIYLAYASSNSAKVACVVNNGMSGVTVSASGLNVIISASSWYAFSFTALAR